MRTDYTTQDQQHILEQGDSYILPDVPGDVHITLGMLLHLYKSLTCTPGSSKIDRTRALWLIENSYGPFSENCREYLVKESARRYPGSTR